MLRMVLTFSVTISPRTPQTSVFVYQRYARAVKLHFAYDGDIGFGGEVASYTRAPSVDFLDRIGVGQRQHRVDMCDLCKSASKVAADAVRG